MIWQKLSTAHLLPTDPPFQYIQLPFTLPSDIRNHHGDGRGIQSWVQDNLDRTWRHASGDTRVHTWRSADGRGNKSLVQDNVDRS